MIFMMVHLEHSKIEVFIEDLGKYMDPSGRYIIGLETAIGDKLVSTNGEHYHIGVDMSKLAYDAFRKTILIRKHSLRGQNKNGLPKQYGIVRNVRDDTRMLMYSVKDKNVFSNFPDEELRLLLEASFPKVDPIDHVKLMMEELQTHSFTRANDLGEKEVDITRVEMYIVSYYRDKKLMKSLSRATLKSLTTRFLMYYDTGTSNQVILRQVYYLINNF